MDWDFKHCSIMATGRASGSGARPATSEWRRPAERSTGRAWRLSPIPGSSRSPDRLARLEPSAHTTTPVAANPAALKRLATTGFGESGDPRGLHAKHGLDPPGIALSVNKFLDR
jgi:hypothetical protein